MCIINFTLSKYSMQDEMDFVYAIKSKLSCFEFKRIVSIHNDSNKYWFEIVSNEYNLTDDTIQILIKYLSLRFQSLSIKFQLNEFNNELKLYNNEKNEHILSI